MSGKHEQEICAGEIPVSDHSQLGKALRALAKKAMGVGLAKSLRSTSCHHICLIWFGPFHPIPFFRTKIFNLCDCILEVLIFYYFHFFLNHYQRSNLESCMLVVGKHITTELYPQLM